MAAFHTRSEWADLTPRLSLASPRVEAAVVHHTVASWRPGQDKAAWLRGLEHSVTDNVAPGNSQPLAAIDYNELIFPDGDVWEGRGFTYEDAATYRFNGQSVSWALIGNYDVNVVPDAMVNALAWRIGVAVEQGWLVAAPRILGHGEVGTFATACPGRFARDRLPEVRALVVSGNHQENDTMADPATQMLLTATLDTLTRLEDKVNHILLDIIEGGYDHRAGTTGAKPYRVTALHSKVDNLTKKVNDLAAK